MPRSLPCLAAALRRASKPAIGELEHARKNFGEVAAIVGRADRRLVGHRARQNEIAPPDLGAVEPELRGGAVGQPLQHIAGLGPPGAAIGIGLRGVGEHAGHLDEDRGRAISAGEQAGIDRARNVGAEGREIGAERRRGLHMQREETAIIVERELGVGEMIACLVVGEEAFGAGGDEAHGAPEPARRPGDEPLLGIDLALVAEAAADVRRDHAQRALGNAELLGHLLADVVRSLRRAREREGAGHRVDCRKRRARLERGADEAIVDEIDRDLVRRARERGAHRRLVAARPAEADIAGCGLMQL